MAGGAALTSQDGTSADNTADHRSAAVAARANLGALRTRFLRGHLPPLGHLIVRLRVPVPASETADDDSPWADEAPWVLVGSWPVPAVLLGRCLNDTTHPSLAHIRMGRTIRVEAEQIVDWAVVDAAGEVVEGGWSRALRHLPGRDHSDKASEPAV